MKHYVQKIILFIFIFILNVTCAHCMEPFKINGLIFDNSDSVIYINSAGEINEDTTIQKGTLKEPDRIYLDINNAILTTPKKTYVSKNSIFSNIKISQFTTEPNVVRLVFEYAKGFDTSSFQVYKKGNIFFIRTNKILVNSPKFKIVYSNTKNTERTGFFKGSKFEEEKIIPVSDINLTENAPKNEITAELSKSSNNSVSKISSKYYIDSISKTKDGIMINGIGKLSLMPAFNLKEPERLIIDLDDTVVSQDLRNKMFSIGEVQTILNKDGDSNITQRETLKIGQNSQSVARLVIQGENAKNYRAVISPDSKSLYLTERSKVIEAKMSDNTTSLLKTTYSSLKDLETINLAFNDSVTFDVFEENNNLYLDINNLDTFDDGILDPIKRAIPDFKTTRLALDKMRFVFPNMAGKNINIKTTPDNDEIRISSKTIKKADTKKEGSSYTPVAQTKKKQAEMSNLFKVVIDAGHGGSDVGATRDGVYEKDITLKIAKLVEKNLNKKKVKTYMVRDKDKTVSLAERSDYSNSIKPDVFVSIHVNSSTNDTSYGIETHWYKEDSRKYAQLVHKEMAKKVKNWKTIDRGLFNSKFYVINHTDAPAILCEIGFISNKNERDEITKTKRQEEIANAIADGIYNYLKARK